MPKSAYNPRIRIAEDERPVLAKRLFDDIQAAIQAKRVLDDNIERWNAQYEGILGAKSDPWPGCANLFVPLTPWQVDTLKANLIQTVFGTTPYWRVEGREKHDEDKA